MGQIPRSIERISSCINN